MIGDTPTLPTTSSPEFYGSITLTDRSTNISDNSRNEGEVPAMLDPEASPLLWVNDTPRKDGTRPAALSCRVFFWFLLALACAGVLFLFWIPQNDDGSNIAQADPVLLSPLDRNTRILTIVRQPDALPSKLWGKINRSSRRRLPLPTNSWYLVCAVMTRDVFIPVYSISYSQRFC